MATIFCERLGRDYFPTEIDQRVTFVAALARNKGNTALAAQELGYSGDMAQ